MSAQEVQAWLRSGKTVEIAGLQLRPSSHPLLPGAPLSISRGQAEAFYTVAADGGQWIIKKFHPGRSPDRQYLRDLCGLIPARAGFTSGWQRRVLETGDVTPAQEAALATWLAGTVFMPRVVGDGWSAVADKLRDGTITCSREERVHLCRSLARCVRELESQGCAHRDLSDGNVFIDRRTWDVALIDWDSMYHPALQMPANTTCGSPGYIAPFVSTDTKTVDAAATWRERADRFALAVCCAEFLVMRPGTPFAGNGGMLEQEDLQRGAGLSIQVALASLRQQFPAAVPLLERALGARGYDECPAPDEWDRFASTLLGDDTPLPRLDEVAWSEQDFVALLTRLTPPAPVWPVPAAPDSVDFACLTARLRHPRSVEPAPRIPPTLPDDPWAKRSP